MFLNLKELNNKFPDEIVLTKKEKDMILMLRHSVEFGSVEIEVKAGEPVFLKRISTRTLLGE